MPQTQKRLAELLNKANDLPLTPGVYIMKDKNGTVIYVGKSRKLKNRVSQYFQNSKKNFKTAKMVSAAEDFEYILCATEIEALSLENTLIKKYSPKYNIKLKDAKSYPYIKITDEEYPKIVFTRNRKNDKGKYFGPFSGASIAYSILDILHKFLGIPNCKRRFPQEIGKQRPCLYYQMRQCCGLCTGKISKEDYSSLINCAANILRGNINSSVSMLEEKMLAFAEEENYEAAAKCRDTIKALTSLNEKQSVVASPDVNADVFGFYGDDVAACMSVMYIRNGVVSDKADFVFNNEAITDSEALSAFLIEHYIDKEYIPKSVILSFELGDDDILAIEEFLFEKVNKRITVKKAERGTFKELATVVKDNATEKIRQLKLQNQKDESILVSLAELLSLESLPERIEAYDISNLGGENITAGMVVYKNGHPSKNDYRLFNIKTVSGAPDDYASMREAIRRRIKHLKEDSSSSFAEYPDLMLIDGGKGHVSVVKEVLNEENIYIPVFGMVKDEFHKTRSLCTEQDEINIAREQAIFMLIYRIQEEVHRFTVDKVMKAKRSTLTHSSLEKIDGIGPAKAKRLLGALGSFTAVKKASEQELLAVKGISKADAAKIYQYFNSKR
jgi:excinuclease ABC subunit C